VVDQFREEGSPWCQVYSGGYRGSGSLCPGSRVHLLLLRFHRGYTGQLPSCSIDAVKRSIRAVSQVFYTVVLLWLERLFLGKHYNTGGPKGLLEEKSTAEDLLFLDCSPRSHRSLRAVTISCRFACSISFMEPIWVFALVTF